MFLTLKDILSHFPIMNITKKDFVKKFRIMYSKSLTLEEVLSLKENINGRKKALIKNPDTDVRYQKKDEMIEYFYEIIIRNRHKYLTCFYNAYFSFKDPRTLKWKGVNLLSNNDKLEYPVISLQRNDASRRIVRNLFYIDLLDKTKITNTVKSKVSFWKSLVNMYNQLELEDRFFAPSSIDLFLRPKKGKKYETNKEINHNNLYYLFQAYQPKASIFNPYSIHWILNNVIPSPNGNGNGKIFSPVLSWCSYLIAYMHSNKYNHYVGVDVMESACEKARFLGNWYNELDDEFKNKKVDIYKSPSQNLLNDKGFLNKYKNYFDTVIICPPYFDMEIYSEGEQSIDSFPDYDDWLDGYFRATVELCGIVLKKGGTFAMIANDYYSLKGEFYPLTKDLNDVVCEFFEESDKYFLQNRTSPLRVNSKKRTERLFLYKK